jgi:2-hydroxychromene-2-carboxylate isomerase
LRHDRRDGKRGSVSSPPAPWAFYFDFISPYSFLAWSQIRALAVRHGRSVEPVPVLFAALLDANGQKGPGEIPAKRRYLFRDIVRKAHRLGITQVQPPPSHPFNPLVALRVASLPLPDDVRGRIIDTLYYAVWTQRRAIDDEARVTALLDEAGLAGAALVADAQTPENKQRLRAATDAAIAAGVFGVPTIIADGELFWGTDSLADLDQFAAGKGPSFEGLSFDDVPATAMRKAVRQ